jgi:hypothetical protein
MIGRAQSALSDALDRLVPEPAVNAEGLGSSALHPEYQGKQVVVKGFSSTSEKEPAKLPLERAAVAIT